jgi:antitoxin (DNA-binding transcriptional repressor) of toxin-antitoxin stability system
MRHVPLARASQSLAKYATELKDEIVVVTKGKRAVAALVPLKNVDRETLTLSAHPEFLALIAKARAEVAAGRVLSLAEIRARVLTPRRASNRGLQPPAPKRRGG